MSDCLRHSKLPSSLDHRIDIIVNEDELDAPQTFHIKTIAGVFHSKKEQHNFLHGECDIYLPDYENASGYIDH